MKRKLAAAAGLLVAWSAAHGEIMTFSIKFDKPVLQPGEVQTISIWADMDPGVGQTVLLQNPPFVPTTVLAFARASFDLINMENAQSGEYSDLATNPGFMGLPIQLGTPDGKGGVSGIFVGQQSPNPLQFVTSDPVLIWQATWTPDHYDPRNITLGLAENPEFAPTVWVDWTFVPLTVKYQFVSAPNSFQVVPAPAAASLLGAGGLLMCRRRRRCESPGPAANPRHRRPGDDGRWRGRCWRARGR